MTGPRRNVEFEPLDSHRFDLGECARWDGKRLTVVDIHAGDVWGCSGVGELEHQLHLGVPISSAHPARPGAIVLTAGDGVALAGGDGPVEWISRPLSGQLPPRRTNDAGVDKSGDLWFGTMDYNGTEGNGSLYRLSGTGSLSLSADGLGCPNGPAFTTGGDAMYLADSTTGTISRYSMSGELGRHGRRMIVDPALGIPDGMALDDHDNLWVALWGGAAIACYSPDGALIDLVDLPVRQPTSISFAGGHAVVTSARHGLDAPGPLDGAVLLLDLPVSGPATLRFG